MLSPLLTRSHALILPHASFRYLRDAMDVVLLKPVQGFFRCRRYCGSNALMRYYFRDFDTVLHSLHSQRLFLCAFSKAVTYSDLTPAITIGTGPGFVGGMETWPVKVLHVFGSWAMKSSP